MPPSTKSSMPVAHGDGADHVGFELGVFFGVRSYAI
jgi:hypothetical protein